MPKNRQVTIKKALEIDLSLSLSFSLLLYIGLVIQPGDQCLDTGQQGVATHLICHQRAAIGIFDVRFPGMGAKVGQQPDFLLFGEQQVSHDLALHDLHGQDQIDDAHQPAGDLTGPMTADIYAYL